MKKALDNPSLSIKGIRVAIVACRLFEFAVLSTA